MVLGTHLLPVNVGARRMLKNIDGESVCFTIKDEISLRSGDRKAIYFQMSEYEKAGSIEYRFCYYMIGVRSGRKGKWVFGQYALLLEANELSFLLAMARDKKWPGI